MIVCKYKFDKSIYENLIPIFNDGYNGYTVTDEIDSGNSNHIIRTIECDVLPTEMRFGRVKVNGETNTDSRTDSLLKVLDMNTSGLTNCNSMFRYNKNLTSISCEWNISNVTDMSYMFNNCKKLTSLDVSNFDTKNVTDMSAMFELCYNLTSLDVSNWDTSNVTSMTLMFNGADSDAQQGKFMNLTSIEGLNNWVTSKVTNMNSLFAQCAKLTSLDISNWNTSNVTDMYGMFFDCRSLTELDLSNWNTDKVTSMQYMFYNCTSLTLLDVSNFNTSKVTTMISMFQNCQKLTTLDVSNWNTKNVTNMSNMFYNCDKLTSLDVSNFDTSNVTNMGAMFFSCDNLTSLDVSNWDTSKVINMYRMFRECQALSNLDLSRWNLSASIGDLFVNANSLKSIRMSNFKQTNQGVYVWYSCDTLEYIDINKMNITQVYEGMFGSQSIKCIRCNVEISIPFIAEMILDRTDLEQGKIITSVEVSSETLSTLASKNWTVVSSNTLTKVAEYVYDSKIWNSMIPKFNNEFIDYFIDDIEDGNGLVTRVISSIGGLPTTMRFGDNSNIKKAKSLLKILDINTSNVTNMHTMFYNCINLTSLDVSNWDTSNVTNMYGMFSRCYKLTSLDVSNWDTSNVTNMNYIFDCCTNLTQLDVSNWDISKITSTLQMFGYCAKLTSLDVSNWNTSNVTDMHDMFNGCQNLTSLDVSNFDTSKVTNFTNIFNNTPKLLDIGMLYCTPTTINTIVSNLPTTHTQTIWVQDTKPSECTVVSSVEFKEYKENSVMINLSSPLLKGDRIEVKDGKLCHYHKMGSVVLDGSEPEFSSNIGYGWTGRINGNYAYEGSTNRSYRLKNAITQTSYHFIVDNFKSVLGRSKKAAYYDGWGLYFFIPNEELQSLDAEGHRAYFRNNPTTVVYQLAEPYYEDITPLQSDITLETYLECNMNIYTNLPIKTNLTYLTNIANTSSIEEEINAINEGTDLTNLLEDEINN